MPGQYDITYFESNRFQSETFSLDPVSEGTISLHISSFKSNVSGTDAVSLDMLLLMLPQSLSLPL